MWSRKSHRSSSAWKALLIGVFSLVSALGISARTLHSPSIALQPGCHPPDSLSSASIAALDISYFKTYGSIDGDQGYAVQQLDDGSVVTALQVVTVGVVYPGLLRTDATGERIFCKRYVGFGAPNAAFDVRANADGFLLHGNDWVLQVDPIGEVIWARRYVFGNGSSISQILVDEDGYFMIGRTWPQVSGYAEIYLSRCDPEGAVLWSKMIETDSYTIGALDLKLVDEGFLLSGTLKRGNFSFTGIGLIRLDAQGDVLWSTQYETTYDDIFNEIVSDGAGGFYLVGTTFRQETDWDPFVLHIDAAGQLLASRGYDRNGTNEQARAAVIRSDGQLAIVFDQGTTKSRSPAIMLIKTDDLSVSWCRSYPFLTQYTNYGLDIDTAPNDGLIVVGNVRVPGRARDSYLIRTHADGHAGCNTEEYDISPIGHLWEVSTEVATTDTLTVEYADVVITAEERPQVTAFQLCEYLPPFAMTCVTDTLIEACRSLCLTFSDSAYFGAGEELWTFEGGLPATALGPGPHTVCWEESGAYTAALTVSRDGLDYSTTRQISIDLDCPPIIPNVFSPNGDGENEVFRILQLPEAYTLRIYDRWGIILHERRSGEDHEWEGSGDAGRGQAPEGVYYYELRDERSARTYRGALHLLR